MRELDHLIARLPKSALSLSSYKIPSWSPRCVETDGAEKDKPSCAPSRGELLPTTQRAEIRLRQNKAKLLRLRTE